MKRRAAAILQVYHEWFPRYTEVLHGQAEALGVPVALMALDEQARFNKVKIDQKGVEHRFEKADFGCLDIAFRAQEGVWLTWNKDRRSVAKGVAIEYERCRLQDGLSFHGIANYGVNEVGLGVAGASLNANPSVIAKGQAGVEARRDAGKFFGPPDPMMLLLLECRTVDDAIRLITNPDAPLTWWSTCMIADRSGRVIVWQSAGTQCLIRNPHDNWQYFTSTNYPHDWEINDPNKPNNKGRSTLASLYRENNLVRIMRKFPQVQTLDNVTRVLRNRSEPGAIEQEHFNSPKVSLTVMSFVIDTKTSDLHIAYGPPSRHKYLRYELEKNERERVVNAMERPKLICAADLKHAPEAAAILEENFDVVYAQATSRALEQHLPRADAYYAALSVRLTEDLLEKAGQLKAVTTPSTGTDHIDLKAAAERDVAVLSLKNDRELLDRITATAELTWSLLLACARRIRAATEAANRGQWGRDAFRGHQLAYKTFGILGCGRLGTIVAQYAQAFRMNVIGHDPKGVDITGVEPVSFDELLRRSDVLSIHVHLNDQTRNLIDRDALAKMKAGAILLNTSRGAIIDESALLETLESGHLHAAGLDVIDGEWRDDLPDHPVIRYARLHENLVVTPHVGGVTYESQAMAYQVAAQKLVDFFQKMPQKHETLVLDDKITAAVPPPHVSTHRGGTRQPQPMLDAET